MKKYLILVKHSVPLIEAGRPARAWKLSEEGQLRAQLLADQLKGYDSEVIISSEEWKARETADIVAVRLGLNVQTAPDLHEHDRRHVPYLSHDDFQRSVREFFEKPGQLVFGSETADQSHARFSRAMRSILNEHKNKTVIVVSHGTVISLFLSRLTGGAGFEIWNELGLPSFVAMDLHLNTLIAKSAIV